MEIAVLGLGCFWGPEIKFSKINGITKTEVGYCGGKNPETSYKEVCSGNTNHAEVVKLEFDPKIITYEEIIRIFFKLHDPTTLNRQGADKGTQYRSVIFYHTESQQKIALEVLKQMQSYYQDKITTEISALPIFYEAETEHQNYYRENPQQGYCTFVIEPKLAKFRKLHQDKLE